MNARVFLRDFITLYENHPCLWQMKNKDYHNRNMKEASYDKLINKLREKEPAATKDDVLKKINNLRSAYRKEQKKVRKSIKSGATGEEVYQPKLWYFELLRFVDNKGCSEGPRSNSDSDDDEDSRHKEPAVYVSQATSQKNASPLLDPLLQTSSVDEHSRTSYIPSPIRPNRLHARSRADIDDEGDGYLPSDVSTLTCLKKPRLEEDRFDVVGKTVAVKLRGLPKHQMLLAEKLINETLFQAEMGGLTMSHTLTDTQDGKFIQQNDNIKIENFM